MQRVYYIMVKNFLYLILIFKLRKFMVMAMRNDIERLFCLWNTPISR